MRNKHKLMTVQSSKQTRKKAWHTSTQLSMICFWTLFLTPLFDKSYRPHFSRRWLYAMWAVGTLTWPHRIIEWDKLEVVRCYIPIFLDKLHLYLSSSLYHNTIVEWQLINCDIQCPLHLQNWCNLVGDSKRAMQDCMQFVVWHLCTSYFSHVY